MNFLRTKHQKVDSFEAVHISNTNVQVLLNDRKSLVTNIVQTNLSDISEEKWKVLETQLHPGDYIIFLQRQVLDESEIDSKKMATMINHVAVFIDEGIWFDKATSSEPTFFRFISTDCLIGFFRGANIKIQINRLRDKEFPTLSSKFYKESSKTQKCEYLGPNKMPALRTCASYLCGTRNQEYTTVYREYEIAIDKNGRGFFGDFQN